MELDDETRAQLGFRTEHPWDIAVARQFGALKRKEASDRYEESPKGKKTRAEYERKFTTRPKRAARAKVVRLKKARTTPVLKGYARIKAWREKNPEKHAANEKRYLKSAKGRAMKSRKNKKYHENRKAA